MVQYLCNTHKVKCMYMSYTTNPHWPRLRAKAIDLRYDKNWSMRQIARHVGVYPSTVSRWFDKAHGFRPFVIPTESSRPHTHPLALSQDIVDEIVKLRLKHNRCAEVVHQELLNKNMVVSLSSVKRTLERQGLIRKRSPWKRWHFTDPRPLVALPGDLVQIDTVHIGPCDKDRLYVYTLLDVFSRWAFAKVSLKINTHLSLRFAKEAQSNVSFPFLTLQSDHGQEFSSWFTEHVQKLDISHRHSRVRQANDNGHLERFNRTIQEECLSKIPQTLRAYQKEIPEYLYYYNNERLHLALELKTPQQVLRSY